MKQKVEQLIDRLADKTLSFGCEVEYKGETVKVVGTGHTDIYFTYKRDCGDQQRGEQKDISTVLGHKITLGQVLDKVSVEFLARLDTELPKLARLWVLCGNDDDDERIFTKSLQEIVEESGWEEYVCSECVTYEDFKKCKDCKGRDCYEKLKNLNARALIDCLLKI